MTDFLVQDYETAAIQVQYPSRFLLSQTDSSQADDVRTILSRFAITGIATGKDPSRDSFIGEMSDDVPADSKTVNDMLDFPDLSYMDEMEMKDYIQDNMSFTDDVAEPKANSSSEPSSDPPSEPSFEPSSEPVGNGSPE
jgi:hypothetical protein